MQEHYQYLKTIPGYRRYFDHAENSGQPAPESAIHHVANFSHGNLCLLHWRLVLNFMTYFKRFAAVFDQTYTRFLDLQKAEAQAKEAKIEAALERIRSRSLGMQRSDELKDVVFILFEKLKELGLEFDGGATIHLFTEGSKDAVIWVSSPDVVQGAICNSLPYDKEIFVSNRLSSMYGRLKKRVKIF
jgi:hypothetical protein